MTLSASPSPFPIHPSTTAILTIKNSGTTGYCCRLASKYKNELNYSQKYIFVSAGGEQLITVAARKKLTPGLRIQLYAVTIEKSLGVPDDDTMKAIIDGSKHLRAPCINLKIDVIDTSVHNAEEHLPGLPPTHIQKGTNSASNTPNDSDVSLFDNYVAHAKKNSYSLANNTDTFYSSNNTYTSTVDSQLCESSVRRSGQVNSQLIDQLDVDMGQLKLQLQTLERKINNILATTPLSSTSTSTNGMLNTSQNFELSQIDMNTLVSAVTQRLLAELKNPYTMLIPSNDKTASCCDYMENGVIAQKSFINEVTNSAVQNDEHGQQEQVSLNTYDANIVDVISREQSEQLTDKSEIMTNTSESINCVSNGREREVTEVRTNSVVSRQVSIPEVTRPSSRDNKGKQLQNVLGNIFILLLIFFVALCTKLLKRALQSTRKV